MNPSDLIGIARALVASGKGLIAIDESTATCNLRLAAVGVEPTEAARRDWRELIITTPGLGESVNGAILVEETLHQKRADGTRFVDLLGAAGILPGLKVDLGTHDLAGHPGEKVTEGLDGLRERLAAGAVAGARFAKWRAVIDPGGSVAGLPSRGAIEANAHALARYAALSQEAGLVPIVEPEVLMDGAHSLQRCAEITEAVLRRVFDQLAVQRVLLEAMILKPNMVLPGLAHAQQPSADEVADASVHCLLRVVPAAVPGVTFLSGGQSGELATARLNAMHLRFGAAGSRLPWALAFSFARAIQQPALQIWAGQPAQREAAQHALAHRARCNRLALRGAWRADLEHE